MKTFDPNNAIHSQREQESQAYFEFIDLSQAVKTIHTLELTLRKKGNEDSVTRGRMMAGLIGLYTDCKEASLPDFLATDLTTSENNYGLFIQSYNRSHLISVARKFQLYTSGTEFTITA